MSTKSAPPSDAEKSAPKPAAKPAVKAAAKPRAKSAVPAGVAPDPTPKAAAAATAKTKGTTKTDKNVKPKKAKALVRDSFTMPQSEYGLIAAVKQRCVAKGLAVKKSEVLRAAIIGFAAQGDDSVMAAMQALEVIKTGRPPKGQK